MLARHDLGWPFLECGYRPERSLRSDCRFQISESAHPLLNQGMHLCAASVEDRLAGITQISLHVEFVSLAVRAVNLDGILRGGEVLGYGGHTRAALTLVEYSACVQAEQAGDLLLDELTLGGIYSPVGLWK
jgi:hypothetical protein